MPDGVVSEVHNLPRMGEDVTGTVRLADSADVDNRDACGDGPAESVLRSPV